MINFLSFLILEGVQGSQRGDLFWFQHSRVNLLPFLSQSEQQEGREPLGYFRTLCLALGIRIPALRPGISKEDALTGRRGRMRARDKRVGESQRQMSSVAV